MATQAKAVIIKEGIRIKYVELQVNFVAVNPWFNWFKHRSGFHSFKVCGRVASCSCREILLCRRKLCIDESGCSTQQILNADKTAPYWDERPDRTRNGEQETTIPGFKASKDCATPLLGASAAGDYRLQPLFVFHSGNPRAFKGNKKHPTRVFPIEPERMDNSLSLRGLVSMLLLLDHVAGRPAHLDHFSSIARVLFLPPNTSLIQPMEQCVISNFNACYLRTSAQALSALYGEINLILRDFWKSYIYRAILTIIRVGGNY